MEESLDDVMDDLLNNTPLNWSSVAWVSKCSGEQDQPEGPAVWAQNSPNLSLSSVHGVSQVLPFPCLKLPIDDFRLEKELVQTKVLIVVISG